jgi:hypothetical protein
LNLDLIHGLSQLRIESGLNSSSQSRIASGQNNYISTKDRVRADFNQGFRKTEIVNQFKIESGLNLLDQPSGLDHTRIVSGLNSQPHSGLSQLLIHCLFQTWLWSEFTASLRLESSLNLNA